MHFRHTCVIYCSCQKGKVRKIAYSLLEDEIKANLPELDQKDDNGIHNIYSSFYFTRL